MTYNVFGGRLNLAQSINLRNNMFTEPVYSQQKSFGSWKRSCPELHPGPRWEIPTPEPRRLSEPTYRNLATDIHVICEGRQLTKNTAASP